MMECILNLNLVIKMRDDGFHWADTGIVGKRKIRVLQTGVERITFQLLVRMLFSNFQEDR